MYEVDKKVNIKLKFIYLLKKKIIIIIFIYLDFINHKWKRKNKFLFECKTRRSWKCKTQIYFFLLLKKVKISIKKIIRNFSAIITRKK